MQFVIRADKPFSGSVQSVMTPAGKVAYTKGLSLDEYAAECGFPLRVVEDDEFDKLMAAYVASRVTQPVEITAEQYDDMLNVLPPCRWNRINGVESFFVSERITANLVNWYATTGGRYFGFVDKDTCSSDEIATKVRAAIAKGA